MNKCMDVSAHVITKIIRANRLLLFSVIYSSPIGFFHPCTMKPCGTKPNRGLQGFSRQKYKKVDEWSQALQWAGNGEHDKFSSVLAFKMIVIDEYYATEEQRRTGRKENPKTQAMPLMLSACTLNLIRFLLCIRKTWTLAWQCTEALLFLQKKKKPTRTHTQ